MRSQKVSCWNVLALKAFPNHRRAGANNVQTSLELHSFGLGTFRVPFVLRLCKYFDLLIRLSFFCLCVPIKNRKLNINSRTAEASREKTTKSYFSKQITLNFVKKLLHSGGLEQLRASIIISRHSSH